MLDLLLARHAAPTLAGLKTGSLFTCACSDNTQMTLALLHWNRLLFHKGLRLLPLHRHRGRTLLYLYRPSYLARDLLHPKACVLLRKQGYPCQSPERCIIHLMHRLANCRNFPHEIGLFLGYPVEDVLGFMEHPTHCKLAGCWKVYGDADAARRLFADFKECTQLYCRHLALGTSLAQLAVPD